jgi:enoyl-CoA hydratase
MTDIVLFEVSERIATITLNRPEARNALSRAVTRRLNQLMHEATDRDDVDVIILTGTDPAFCAGVDLKELGGGSSGIGDAAPATSAAQQIASIGQGPFHFVTKPLIGAINGVAITGGFELALNCDFLIASERAKFGDTHARVGVMPGWGLTVLLPQAIGVRRAREMSFTGNFLSAEEALQWGLVNHVVAHDDLMATARGLAIDIIGNDQPGVRQIRETYNAVAHDDAGWEREASDSARWITTEFTPEKVAARREAIQARGRMQ